MIYFYFKKIEDVGILTFHGDLTEDLASGLIEALMVSLSNAEHVVVNFERVTRIDNACIYLLSLAHRKSERLKKKLTLTGINFELHTRVEYFD